MGSEAIVAGVNPNGLGRLLGEWARTGWKMPRIISASVDLPLRVDVDAPDKVGIDRLLNAVGANVVRQPGVAAIIVDTGTATTVDVISSAGAFRGGAILPGLELASRSLHLYTAFLPEIPIEELAALVPNPLGTSTRAALRSGIFWGQVGAVKELVERLSAIEHQPVELYVTGGGGGLLAPHLGASAKLFPALALQGLALVAERLRGDASQ